MNSDEVKALDLLTAEVTMLRSRLRLFMILSPLLVVMCATYLSNAVGTFFGQPAALHASSLLLKDADVRGAVMLSGGKLSIIAIGADQRACSLSLDPATGKATVHSDLGEQDIRDAIK